jgi:hypothetical protein
MVASASRALHPDNESSGPPGVSMDGFFGPVEPLQHPSITGVIFRLSRRREFLMPGSRLVLMKSALVEEILEVGAKGYFQACRYSSRIGSVQLW